MMGGAMIIGVLALALAAESRTTPFETIVVAAANDYGYGQDVPLRYAESDAAAFAGAIAELGAPRKIHRAIGQDAHAIHSALSEAKNDVAAARGSGQKTLLLFYYSGHADGDYLRLGGTRITWGQLKKLLTDAGADVIISIIDACDSGSATAAKGATHAGPLIDVPHFQDARGSMWITSSRENEASYESDELGGSFFSHFLVSGLRGAADLDEDGTVTLREVYEFSYDRTVGETSLKLRRTQHPTYRTDLRGEGEIVLSEPKHSRTNIVLPRETSGQWFVARRFGAKRAVLEVPKSPGSLVRMSVPAGSYLVYRKDPQRIMLLEISLTDGEEVVVDPQALRSFSYAEVLEKGGGVSLAAWHLRAGPGYRGPLFSGSPAVFDLELTAMRSGRIFGLGATVAVTSYRLQAVDTPVRTREVYGELFASAVADLGFCTGGVGLGAAMLYASQETNKNTLSSLSPGLAAQLFANYPLTGSFSIAAASGMRAFLVPLEGGRQVEFAPFVQLGLGYDLD